MLRSIPRHHLALLLGLSLLAAACGDSSSGEDAPPPIARPDGDQLTGGDFAPYDSSRWRFTTGGDATLEASTDPDFDSQCLEIRGDDLGSEPYATQLVYWDDGESEPKYLDLTPGTYRIHARVRASGAGRSVQIVLQDGSYRDLQELAFTASTTAQNYRSGPLAIEEPVRVTFKVNLGGTANRDTTFHLDDLFLVREGQTAGAPEFTPAPGTFDASQNVTLASSTGGATIYYTMTSDGSAPADPTTASTQYTAPLALAQPATDGTETVYRIKAIAVADGMTSSRVVSGTYTIRNLAESAPYAIKFVGTTATNYGETSVSIQFNLSGPTDFTAEDYTASFDIYIPSPSDTQTAPTKVQTQYPNAAWAPMYFDKYPPFQYNAWQTLTYEIKKANRSYPGPTAADPLLSNSTRFRVGFNTAAAGQPVVFYLKNLRVTNGSNTPLNIQITSSTNVGALGIYVANGTATPSLAQQ